MCSSCGSRQNVAVLTHSFINILGSRPSCLYLEERHARDRSREQNRGGGGECDVWGEYDLSLTFGWLSLVSMMYPICCAKGHGKILSGTGGLM